MYINAKNLNFGRGLEYPSEIQPGLGLAGIGGPGWVQSQIKWLKIH